MRVTQATIHALAPDSIASADELADIAERAIASGHLIDGSIGLSVAKERVNLIELDEASTAMARVNADWCGADGPDRREVAIGRCSRFRGTRVGPRPRRR